MKRLSILFIIAVVATVTMAQEAINFKPNWKKGQKKIYELTTIQKEDKEGESATEKMQIVETFIEIYDEDNDNFYMALDYDNVVFNHTEKYKALLGGETIGKGERITFKYSVNKETGKEKLLNWEEVKEDILGDIESVVKVIAETDSARADQVGAVFGMLGKLFANEEAVEGMIKNEVELFLMPYKHELKLNETVEISDTARNPFASNKREEMAFEMTSIVGTKMMSKGLYDIEVKTEIDTDPFKKMIVQMIKGFSMAFAKDESAKADMEKKMDELEKG